MGFEIDFLTLNQNFSLNTLERLGDRVKIGRGLGKRFSGKGTVVVAKALK